MFRYRGWRGFPSLQPGEASSQAPLSPGNSGQGSGGPLLLGRVGVRAPHRTTAEGQGGGEPSREKAPVIHSRGSLFLSSLRKPRELTDTPLGSKDPASVLSFSLPVPVGYAMPRADSRDVEKPSTPSNGSLLDSKLASRGQRTCTRR